MNWNWKTHLTKNIYKVGFHILFESSILASWYLILEGDPLFWPLGIISAFGVHVLVFTKIDFLHELQFEDTHDPFVMQILAQKDADVYEPPVEYHEIRDIFQSCGEDPWQQNKSLCSYRFYKIQEMVSGLQFSMDWILAYLSQLMIIEYWNELDESKGRAILDTFKN